MDRELLKLVQGLHNLLLDIGGNELNGEDEDAGTNQMRAEVVEKKLLEYLKRKYDR